MLSTVLGTLSGIMLGTMLGTASKTVRDCVIHVNAKLVIVSLAAIMTQISPPTSVDEIYLLVG